MGSPSKRETIAWIVSVVVIVVGIVVVVTSAPVSFGWFAYTAESGDGPFPGDLVVVRRQTIVGALLLVAGLVGLGLLIGIRLGARRQD